MIPKYRAWHKEYKTMKPVLELDLDPDKGVFVENEQPENDDTQYRVYGEYWFWREIELMQFTGLQDRTGKDIYEGDLVRTNNEQEESEPVEDQYYGVVTYNPEKGHYYIKQPDSSYTPTLGNYTIVSIEIIGNIWEQQPIEE